MTRALSDEVQYLKGVGPKNAQLLAKIDVKTVEDVLFYLPRRYEDRRNLPPIAQAKPGEFATIRGRLHDVEGVPTRRGMVIVRAIVADRTGSIHLTWFNQPWVRRALEKCIGQDILAYGMIKDTGRAREMSTPEWEPIEEEEGVEGFARIVPVYPLTEGLPQRLVRAAAAAALPYLDLVQETLPLDLRRRLDLMPVKEAIRNLHAPESDEARDRARKRLVFEEFLILQLALAMKRAQTHQETGIAFPIAALLAGKPVAAAEDEAPATATRKGAAKPQKGDAHLFAEEGRSQRDGEPLWDQVHRMLPFTLTGAQQRVIGEIWDDMALPHPMNRLVQGDVGSGKTAVAAAAMLAAIRSGYQAALMAPTEILAEQHAQNLSRLFEPLGIEVALLVGKLSATQKRKAAERTATGAAQIAIGTHALIQEGVGFRHLGLAVIDEQHRFGVLQRAALREKGLGNPDVLVMTATPIPRTLTMTMYGDLDVSLLDELPPGRQAIKTHFKPPSQRQSVYDGVRNMLAEGRQAYVVCPMVGESEKMLAQAATELYERLRLETFPDLRVGLLHGQMKPKEKEDAMAAFRAHETDVLVATTVIEVGVDVPNASVMIIEDANRFGLAQLHQLRGRVGRGPYQSFCILIGDARSPDALERMNAMVETSDGFRIAEIDLRLRGPGEVAGTRQSGNLDFKLADLVRDARLLEVARQVAMEAVSNDPNLETREWSRLRDKVLAKHTGQALVAMA